MNLNKQIKATPQKELMQVLGLSRPLISNIQNDKRPLTEAQQATLEDYFDSQQPDDSVRINIPQKHLEKFKQVFLYVLQQVGAKTNVGETVLYKLLYFIDFDFYEKHEEQLMGLTYIKNTHGPTPREFKAVVDEMVATGLVDKVKAKHFTFTQKKYLPVLKPDLSQLNGAELAMVNSVLDRYSDLSATQLSELSHEDTPWRLAKDRENIEYEHVFYRPDRFSVREYEAL
jgi:uncharacterized phage-associated protein